MKKAAAYAVIILGFCMILYFPLAEFIRSRETEKIISQIDTGRFLESNESRERAEALRQEVLSQARSYNARLSGNAPEIPAEQIWSYDRQLAPDGYTGAFGYVVIPQISVREPVYHGTGEAVLSAGAGHLEGTSLPVGGESTHAVISAHSGASGMKAFDDIRDLKEGDYFAFKVSGETLGYRVCEIVVTTPDDLSKFDIRQGRDLMTLVTCTPYGINDHRLLVTGERAELPADFFDQKPDLWSFLTNRRVWPVLAAVILLAGGGICAKAKKKRRKN